MTNETIILVLSLVTATGSVVAAVAAFFAAKGSLNAAKQTLLASHAQIISTFLGRYSAPEMLSALRKLRHWQSDHPSDFAEKYFQNLQHKNPDAEEVDRARRHVKNYFLNAVDLYEAEIIDKAILKAITSRDGIHILYEIVEPLELQLNPASADFVVPKIKLLRDVVGIIGTKRVMNPIYK